METKELNIINLSRFSIRELTSNFWNDCITNGSLQKLNDETFIKNNNQYGICIPIEHVYPGFEYVIGIEVKDDVDIPKDYHVRTIPEATYAVFKAKSTDRTNFSNEIERTWVRIIMDWLPAAGYEYIDSKANFCFYDARYNNKKPSVGEIYVPVMKKQIEKSSKNNETETKKCKNCLRRIPIHYYICPYCRRVDFEFDIN